MTNKSFKIILIVLIFLSNGCEEATNQLSIGDWYIDRYNYSIPLIADIRNDGIERSYINDESAVYEMTYENGKWIKTNICDTDINSLVAACCYHDGVTRLYGFYDGNIYEIEYSGDNWSVELIYAIHYVLPDTWVNIFVGDSRNEGFESLYLNYYGTDTNPMVQWEPDVHPVLSELSFRNGKWEENIIENSFSNLETVVDIAVGDGRVEGKDYIYVIDCYFTLAEYSYDTGSGWHRTIVDQVLPLDPYVTYFPGPNIEVYPVLDNQSSIFVSAFEIFWEYRYQNNIWRRYKIGDLAPDLIRGGIGRNDGINRIYCAAEDLLEFTYNNSSWEKTAHVTMKEFIKDIVIGPGRGDGIQRIYLYQENQGTFELTYKY